MPYEAQITSVGQEGNGYDYQSYLDYYVMVRGPYDEEGHAAENYQVIVIQRRYSEFAALVDHVSARFPTIAACLPPKSVFRKLFLPGFLADRQEGLNTLIAACLRWDPDVQDADLCDFLEIDRIDDKRGQRERRRPQWRRNGQRLAGMEESVASLRQIGREARARKKAETEAEAHWAESSLSAQLQRQSVEDLRAMLEDMVALLYTLDNEQTLKAQQLATEGQSFQEIYESLLAALPPCPMEKAGLCIDSCDGLANVMARLPDELRDLQYRAGRYPDGFFMRCLQSGQHVTPDFSLVLWTPSPEVIADVINYVAENTEDIVELRRTLPVQGGYWKHVMVTLIAVQAVLGIMVQKTFAIPVEAFSEWFCTYYRQHPEDTSLERINTAMSHLIGME